MGTYEEGGDREGTAESPFYAEWGAAELRQKGGPRNENDKHCVLEVLCAVFPWNLQ